MILLDRRLSEFTHNCKGKSIENEILSLLNTNDTLNETNNTQQEIFVARTDEMLLCSLFLVLVCFYASILVDIDH